MAIYDLDTIELAYRNVPPDKRHPKIMAFVISLLSGVQVNIDAYQLYREGDDYLPWDSGAAYSIGDIVTYQGVQYISLQNANTNNRPAASPTFWLVTNPNAIGADERIRYQPNKLIFEYALNKHFGSTFRQPPATSDIYITNSAYFNPSFIVGGIESNSSAVYANRSQGVVINDYFVQLPYSFEINIPAAIYTDLGGTDSTVRNFADRYVVAGKQYIITVV